MYSAILLLPLLGAVLAGFFHRQIGEKGAMYVSTGLLIFCAVLSWIAFFTLDEPGSVELFRWIGSGDLQAYWSIRVDRLTVVMLVVVTVRSVVLSKPLARRSSTSLSVQSIPSMPTSSLSTRARVTARTSTSSSRARSRTGWTRSVRPSRRPTWNT